MSKRRRIEITFFRRTVVRYAGSCGASPVSQPHDDKDASQEACDDSSQAKEPDGALDQRHKLLQVRKETAD